MKGMEVFLPRLGDPWLDNGLEVLHRALKEVGRQIAGTIRVRMEPDGMRAEVLDLDRTVKALGDLIGLWVKERLFYRPSSGQEKPKGFTVFDWRQPPRIFHRERGFSGDVSLLKKALSLPSSKGTPCPICGLPGADQSLTQSVHILATKIRSLSGTRTKAEGGFLRGFKDYNLVCARCYLRGAMVWLDDGLIYRTGSRARPSFVILPAPPGYDMLKLAEIKDGYRRSLRIEGEVSNVKVVVRRGAERAEESAPGGNSLLLAFLERLLWDILSEAKREGFWGEVRRKVSEGWLLLTIPMGAMKNVTARDVVIDEPRMRLLGRCVEELGFLPYADMVALLWLVERRTGEWLTKETDDFREEMSRAILEGDFGLFASLLLPRGRAIPVIPMEAEGRLEEFVREWRCERMSPEVLEVVKRAGRALGQIAFGPEGRQRGAPTLLYSLERVRSLRDMLDVLEKACHRVIAGGGELGYSALEALEKLTEIAHQVEAGELEEIKRTLTIFASLEWARRARQAASKEGGEG